MNGSIKSGPRWVKSSEKHAAIACHDFQPGAGSRSEFGLSLAVPHADSQRRAKHRARRKRTKPEKRRTGPSGRGWRNGAATPKTFLYSPIAPQMKIKKPPFFLRSGI